MAKLKDLPGRSWEQLAELWLEHFPPECEPYEENTIETLQQYSGAIPADKHIIERVPQLRETTLYLSCMLRRKAAYCLDAGREMNEQGFPTGAAIIMYDASFYAAKSLIYLLGIVEAGRDSKAHIDIFYQEPAKKTAISKI